MSDEVEIARFRTGEPVEDCASVLDAAGIRYRLASDSSIFDYSSIGAERTHSCMIMVSSADLIRARTVLLEHARRDVAMGLPEDCHLLDWSDQDLLAVVQTPGEWCAHDVASAESILQKRRIDPLISRFVDPKSSVASSEEELKHVSWTIFALGFIAATFGGLLGILIGLIYSESSGSSEGKPKKYTYDERSRKIAAVLALYGMIMLIVWFVLLIKPWRYV